MNNKSMMNKDSTVLRDTFFQVYATSTYALDSTYDLSHSVVFHVLYKLLLLCHLYYIF